MAEALQPVIAAASALRSRVSMGRARSLRLTVLGEFVMPSGHRQTEPDRSGGQQRDEDQRGGQLRACRTAAATGDAAASSVIATKTPNIG